MADTVEVFHTAQQALLELQQAYVALRDHLREDPNIAAYPATLPDAMVKVELALTNLANAMVVHPLNERVTTPIPEEPGGATAPQNTILP